MSAALSNLLVLDLSRILAGPWAGQILADLGAEVIKVERPGVAGDTRGWGPPFMCDEQGRETAEAAYFLCANRNKQSMTVDFTKPQGQLLLRRLASQADVVIENFKAGGLQPYGLDYESLHSQLIPLLNALTVQRTTAQWVERLEVVGVPCGPINALDAVFRDPQILARGMRVEIEHPVAGTVPGVANPIRLSETPITYRSAPPPLGAHPREVLQQRLGLEPGDVDALRASGVV